MAARSCCCAISRAACIRPRWPVAAQPANKWLSARLLIFVLFAYECSTVGRAAGDGPLILAYFVGALVVDSLFKRAASASSSARSGSSTSPPPPCRRWRSGHLGRGACAACRPRTASAAGPTRFGHVLQRGCELGLFQPQKVGNLDCTFCLDCVHACPHDNVGITARLPARSCGRIRGALASGASRSARPLGARAALLFGALLNAFGMVSPIYALQAWIAGALGLAARHPCSASCSQSCS